MLYNIRDYIIAINPNIRLVSNGFLNGIIEYLLRTP